MRRSQIHLFAVVVAAVALLVIFAGGLVTGERKIASQNGAAPLLLDLANLGSVHRALGMLLAVLTAGLAVVLGREERPEARTLGWAALAGVLLTGGLGFAGGLPGVEVTQAVMAHVTFTLLVMVGLVTSLSWEQGPELFDASRWPPLAGAASIIPLVVLAQVLLGALYRHKVLGVMPHMGGAMVVTLLLLGVSVFVIQTFPDIRAVRQAAIAALTVTLIQISLGISVFVMGLVGFEATTAALISGAAHVATGSMTLAASVVFSVEIRRNARLASAAVTL